ncbi:MAG: hypothetical protein QW065_03245 [Acidilobaceae archaeon]
MRCDSKARLITSSALLTINVIVFSLGLPIDLTVRVAPGLAIDVSLLAPYILSLIFSIGLLIASSSLLASLSLAVSSLLFVHLSFYYFVALALSSATILTTLTKLRGSLSEPSLDLVKKDLAEWSPIALSSAGLSLYVLSFFLDLRLEPWAELVYAVSSLVSALISSASSRSLQESLVLGTLSALGPLGLAVVSVWFSLRPIPPSSCEGVVVGELVALEANVSSARGAIAYSKRSDRVFACSERAEAVLKLMEPWILWGYGELARKAVLKRVLSESSVYLNLCRGEFKLSEVEEEIERALSQKAKRLSLELGSISPIEVRVAYALSLAKSLAGKGFEAVAVDVSECSIPEEELGRIASEAPRFAKKVVVFSSGLPWGTRKIAPKGSAASSGFIAGGFRDPAEARSIAELVAPEAVGELTRLLLEGRIGVGYPGCRDEFIMFES